MPVEDVTKLEAVGIDTCAKFAFCCNFQPGSQDDAPLFATILERKTEGSVASRRLFFESHALCLQDLKARLERTEQSV